MAGRVNTKFVVLLSSVIVLVVLAVAGVYVLKVMRSADQLIREGDVYLAQNQDRMALQSYGRAVAKRPDDVELIQKYVATMRRIDVRDIVEAKKFLGLIQSGVRQASEVDPTDQALLTDYYELQLSLIPLFGKSGYDELYRLSSIKLEQYPDNLTARKYRGIAQVNRLSTSMSRAEQVQAYEDLLKVYEQWPDDAQVAHHLALWSLFEANRLEQTAGDPAEIEKLRDNAVALSRQMLEQDPDDLDRRLFHLQILLDPKVNLTDEARPIADRIEADLLEAPEPDTAILTMAETLPRLDTQPVARDGRRDTTVGVQRAQRLLEAAVAKAPDRVLFRTMLGRLHALQGNVDAAVEQYAKAWDLGMSAPAIEAIQAYNMRLASGLEEMDLRLGQIDSLAGKERDALLAKADQRVNEIESMLGGENGRTLLLRGKLATARREFGKAMQQLDRAAELLAGTPNEIEALLLSAQARRLSGERGAAAEQLDKIVQRIAAPAVMLELAELRFDMKQFEQAQALVDRVLAANADDARARLLQARLLAVRGETDQAIEMFESLDLKAHPQAILPLAQLYAARGDDERAKQLIAQQFEQAPQNVQALGLMLRLTPDKPEQLALIAQSRAAGGNPAVLDLLQQQIESGEAMSREDLTEQLIEQQEDPVLRELAQAMLHRRAGDAQQADAALARAADLNPDHPQVVERQFELAIEGQRWDEAARVAARAGSLNLDLAGGSFFRGKLAAARGRAQEAVAEFRRGLSARPVFSDGWRQMGDAQRAAGNLDAAADAYERSLNQRPDNTLAVRGLAGIADARGDHPRALKLLKDALRQAPRDSELLAMYLAYEQQYGDPAQALRLRQQLAQANPGDTANRRALALLLAQQDRVEEAVAAADALLAEQGETLANIQTAAAVQAITGDVDAGRSILEQYISSRGDQATADDLVALARYLLSANDPGALDAYHRARKLEDPGERPVTRELADLLFARGANEQALPLYRSLHEQNPGEAKVGLRYAETLIRMGQAAEAQKLLDQYPDQASGQVLEAALAMEKKDRAGAIEALQRGLTIDPQNVLARVQLATLLAEDPAQIARARELLGEALRIDPDSTPARLTMATLHQRLGEIPEAIRELQALLDREPNNTAVRLRLVNLYVGRAEFPAARGLLEQAAQRDPDNADWSQLLSRLAARSGDKAAAIDYARRTVELAPSVPTVAELATLLIGADRASEALAVLDDHPAMVNAEPVLQSVRGWALAKSGQAEPARQVFIRAVERAANLGQTLAVTNRIRSALGHAAAVELLSSMEQPPHPTWVAIAAAEIQVHAREYDDAARRLQAIEADAPPTDPAEQAVLQRLLAMALHQSGRPEPAKQAYERLLKLQPNDVATLNNLAYLLVEDLNQPRQGLTMAQRAADLQPDNPQILDTLGWAQFKAGQTSEARSTLERSIEIQPLAPSCYHLARVYAQLGIPNLARSHVMQAIDLAEQTQDHAVQTRAESLLKELGS